jgi:hypothetical protein
MITIFRNIKETSTPFFKEVGFVLERIKTGHSKELVESIRNEDDKSVRNELKKGLSAICFSGTFNKRQDESIIDHSGLVCLDFDGYETPQEMDADKLKMSLDPFVMSVFISPSGKGLKAIVKIPKEPHNHKRYFEGLRVHFNSKYFDVTSKNISRVCYESWDPDIHINNDSDLWDTIVDQEAKPIDRPAAMMTIPVTNEGKIVDRLMMWWTRDYGLVDGERNHNVFILASALNDFGVKQSTAEYVIGQMSSADFTTREILTTITSAYRNVSAHGTKFYEDEEELHRIRTKIVKGASSTEIKKDLRELKLNEDAVDDVLMNLTKDPSAVRFWEKSNKGIVKPVHYLLKEYLENHGFYKFYPHQSDKFIFVRVTNNLINKSNEDEVKDHVLSYLKNHDDLSIYNHFADKTRYFKEDFLSLLDKVNVHFLEDTLNYSHIYFNNCVVKATKDGIERIEYVDLGGYVWKDQVIDRDYDTCDGNACDFSSFVSNVSNKDEGRISTLKSTIGYLLSSYKDTAYCPAVIFNDESLRDTPEGGTGKGLFVQAIGQLKKVAKINGKTMSTDNRFSLQTVSTDTQIISFDDARKGFDFEGLFSHVTDSMVLEKKNKQAIEIPFAYSPKIVITTNYALKGKGDSFVRRKFELEFNRHYKAGFTPADEFGRRFFEGWDIDEWCRFDNYMVDNLVYYIKNGLIASESETLDVRKLGQETCHEFLEWAGLIKGIPATPLLKYNRRILKDTLYGDFVEDNPDFSPRYKGALKRTDFYKWLGYFATFQGVEVLDGRESMGRWIIFKSDDSEQPTDDSLEF